MKEGHSPVIHLKTEELLDFPEAMRKVINGKKVTRPEWGSHYVELKGEWLMYHKEDGDHSWQIRDVDMLGTDYKVLKEAN